MCTIDALETNALTLTLTLGARCARGLRARFTTRASTAAYLGQCVSHATRSFADPRAGRIATNLRLQKPAMLPTSLSSWAPIALNMRTFSSETSKEPSSGDEVHTFQAETRQLLDIVTNSLYTDKEVLIHLWNTSLVELIAQCFSIYM